MASVSDTFDYIEVGAGSAGCVVASRLVKDHGATVLLLEAGPPDIQIYCIGLMWPTLTVKPRNAVTLLANLVRPLSYGSARL